MLIDSSHNNIFEEFLNVTPRITIQELKIIDKVDYKFHVMLYKLFA
jgi:hypothetical protein